MEAWSTVHTAALPGAPKYRHRASATCSRNVPLRGTQQQGGAAPTGPATCLVSGVSVTASHSPGSSLWLWHRSYTHAYMPPLGVSCLLVRGACPVAHCCTMHGSLTVHSPHTAVGHVLRNRLDWIRDPRRRHRQPLALRPRGGGPCTRVVPSIYCPPGAATSVAARRRWSTTAPSEAAPRGRRAKREAGVPPPRALQRPPDTSTEERGSFSFSTTSRLARRFGPHHPALLP